MGVSAVYAEGVPCKAEGAYGVARETEYGHHGYACGSSRLHAEAPESFVAELVEMDNLAGAYS
jgi:hypothetical protein